MKRSLKQTIHDNRRHYKYERLLRRIRLNIFLYEDQGNLEKAQRIISKCKAICGPRWAQRQKRLADKHADRLWNL